jgi:hypothetical protein
MIVRRQFGNSNDAHNEYNLGEGVGQRYHELRRSASVSSEPIDHPGVGIVVVGFQGPVGRVSFPVGVRQAAGVLMVRIARVCVEKRCLGERK